MTNPTSAFRGLLVYGLVLPLALVVGYLMATPTDLASAGTLGLVLLVICAPLFLKWHYPVLILSWGLGTTIFFLPGSPSLWMCMAFVSLLISLVQRAMDKQMRFISAPSLSFPIIFLALIILVTARVTGGFGMRILGSASIGGRRYLLMMAAIAAYFAMTSHRVPVEKALFYIGLFFLGSLANAVSTLIPYGPSELYFLALLFPVGGADASPLISSGGAFPGFGDTITRFYGLTVSCLGCCCYLLARYGIRSMLSGAKVWRFGLFATIACLGAAGGFRSFLIITMITFVLVFCFEGLLRSRYTGALILVALFAMALAVPFARHLPLSLQRSLSTLPVDVDPVARYDAEASSEWRLKMWTTVLPEVPRYLWFGKGLSIDSQELELTGELGRRYLISSQEASMLAGDYHSGPLTVLIPFGIWGLLAWLWFLAAAIRALYRNYRFGGPELKKINVLLLAFFLARTVVFIVIFGNFYTDLAEFLGLLGLSISLNHGICSSRPVVSLDTETAPDEIAPDTHPVPALSRA